MPCASNLKCPRSGPYYGRDRTRWAHDFEEGGACCQNTKRLLHFIETDPGPCDDSNRRSRYHGSSAVGWLLSIVRQVFAMAPQTS